jgi:hypothetical protein
VHDLADLPRREPPAARRPARRRTGCPDLPAAPHTDSRAPAPAQPDPQILEFLDFEREWITGTWDLQRIAQAMLAPLALTAYCAAFWRRSVLWGLVLLNVMTAGKLLWGVVVGDGTGWAMTVPGLVGLLIGDVAVLWALRRLRARRQQSASEPSAPPLVSSTTSS